MVNITITDAWVTLQETLDPKFVPNSFTIQIGEQGFEYMADSNQIMPNDPTSPGTQGGPSLVILRPYESFDIGDVEFQNLVLSAQNGGSTDFITNILYLVRRAVIEVQQDGGTPLTPKQIINYTAP